ncbi:MAG: hypothetical protein ACI9P7_000509 [Candidatus Azotimanducaceae bacterium]|jgi:hypothetical protein
MNARLFLISGSRCPKAEDGHDVLSALRCCYRINVPETFMIDSRQVSNLYKFCQIKEKAAWIYSVPLLRPHYFDPIDPATFFHYFRKGMILDPQKIGTYFARPSLVSWRVSFPAKNTRLRMCPSSSGLHRVSDCSVCRCL